MSLQFTNNNPIYIQIADYILEMVISEQWVSLERIPSVRELASEVEVNPNTVARTYAFLSDRGIIANKRGIGYFITPDAKTEAIRMKKSQFIKEELPNMFAKMDLLNIQFDEIIKLYDDAKKNDK